MSSRLEHFAGAIHWQSHVLSAFRNLSAGIIRSRCLLALVWRTVDDTGTFELRRNEVVDVERQHVARRPAHTSHCAKRGRDCRLNSAVGFEATAPGLQALM
jgi:hypothetical protein